MSETARPDSPAGHQVAPDDRQAVGLDFRLLAETIPHAVWSACADGYADYVNTRFQEYVGKPMKELAGWSWTDIVHPEDLQRSIDTWQEAIRTGRGYRIEYRLRRVDGCYLWHEGRAIALRDASGRIVRWFGTCTDIEGRKAIEAQLRESESKFRTLHESMRDAFVSVTMDGRILEFNHVYQDMLGYTADELRSKTYVDLTPAKWHAFEAQIIAEQILPRGYSEVYEKEYRRKDGTLIPIELRTVLLRSADGEPELMWATVRDTSERKRAEEALRVSQQKYQRLVEGLDEQHCVFSHTAEGVFLYVSKNFERLFGVPVEKIVGKDWRELNLTPESLQAGEESDRRIIEERSMQTVELTCIHPDESRHIIEVTYGPVIEDGRVVYMEGICTDITEIKQSAKTLAAAKEAAEAANRAKSEFLTNMSHEIRTPINGIMGMAQLLEYTELSANQKDYLEAIRNSSESLLALVNDVLDLARIESGKIELECAEFSLRGSLSDVVRSQIALAHAKGLSLKTVIPADVPDDLTGDQLRLKQILFNLVGNAIKFTETGEIALSIILEERQENTALLRFDVTDSGIGIKDEVIEKIFTPFSQADASMTRRFGGSGLGLAICSQLTELMGGGIAVASRVGVGSTFQVRLPFAVNDVRPARSNLHKAGSSPVWEGAPCRVLLAEDNDTSRMFFVEVLKKYGHQVDIAVDGAEALEKWSQSTYDLILMDVQMPVMDGIEALGKLREVEKHQGGHVPVIALTAHAMTGYRSDVLSRGFDGYVSKPTRIRDLFSEMKRCLAARSG